jgi:zinc protease
LIRQFNACLAALTLSCGLAASGISTSPASAEAFSPSRFVLDNGLELVVIEDHRRAAVAHFAYYKVGAIDEEPGKTGLAHFLEHLMFKGTDNLDPGEFSRIVARNGGRDNAFTSANYTGYFQVIAADRLGLIMKMEADRMTGLKLDDAIVLPERDVVLEERLSRVENRPSALLGEAMRANLYLAHPYRRPIIGWPPEVKRLTTEDALAFYRKWYAPNNVVVVIAGDVNPNDVLALAQDTYGAVAARPLPERRPFYEPDQRAPRRVVFSDPRVRQEDWRRMYVAPAYDGAAPVPYALNVLSEIMSGETGRLHNALVERQKIALGVSFWYDGSGRDYGSAGLYGRPVPGVETTDLEAAFDAEIAKLLKDGVTEDEVRDAKRRLAASAIFARDSLDGPARIVGGALANGQRVEDIEEWPERIAAVDRAAIDAAARALFNINWSVTGILRPAPKEGAPS